MLRALESPTPLRRYLDLKADIKAKTAEMKEIEPVILTALYEEDDQRAEAFGFKLEAGVSKTYDYSPAVDALDKELKALKAQERKSGVAVPSRLTGYVRVSEAVKVETFEGLPVEKNTAPAGARPF